MISSTECAAKFTDGECYWEQTLVRYLLLLVWFCAAMAMAQQADMYRVEVTVKDQSDAERTLAAAAALGDVVARVSGSAESLQHPLIQQALTNAPSYISKFNYPSDTTLVLNFAPAAVQALLTRAQIGSPAANSSQGIVLTVVDVEDFSAFKQVQSYLKTLSMVRRVELVAVEGAVMRVSVLLDADAEQLKASLAESNRLQLVTDAGAEPLRFRWQR
jgi:hypothetical protein